MDAYKEKYQSLIEEIESKEQQWAQMDQRVRRTLSHLLIIAQGPSNSKINSLLGEVRDSLKKGADLGEIESEVSRIKEEVLTESRDTDSSEPPPPVNEIIIQLLQRIPLPKDMMSRVTELIKQLEGGLSSRMVPWAINSVGNLVMEVRRRMEEEKQELESLLREITAKIDEMGKTIGLAGAHALDGFVSNKSLTDKVTAQVAAIRNSATHATDLNSFRTAVNSAIEAIQGQIDAKLIEDKRREEQLRGEVENLRQHVATLQTELVDHQEKLKKAMDESHKDPLTGCLNRMSFDKKLSEEISRSNRFSKKLSLVLLDLDKFKNINDHFGHIAGDQVLKAVSKIAEAQIREIDAFCRYGGEEFGIVLPETEMKGALAVAEKVRTAVENFRFHSRGQRVVITLSAGVAEFSPGESQETFIDRADKALYRAKQEGRNRSMTAN